MVKSYYRAIDSKGLVHTGYMESANAQAFTQHLQAKGLVCLPLTPWQKCKLVIARNNGKVSWSANQAALFTLHLAQLLEAGVPILDCFTELAQLEPNKAIKAKLLAIRSNISRGMKLSDALAQVSSLFNNEYIAIVSAGELSGELSSCLFQLHSSLQWHHRINQQLKTALVYPCFAAVVVVAVSLFLLVFLVPAMRPFLSAIESDLPLHTQWLLTLSSLLSAVSPLGAVTSLLLALLMPFVLLQIRKCRKILDGFLLKGAFGSVFSHLALAQYARSSGILYSAGVDISEAIRLAGKTVSNRKLRDELEVIRIRILDGSSLSLAFSESRYIPSLFVHLISAGERAGVLGNAFCQAAEQMQSSANYAISRYERLLGPVMLCVLGGMLLWIVVSLFGPVYSSIVSTGALV